VTSETLAGLVAALVTVALLGYLWGDNPLLRSAEHLLIGVSAGYWITIAFWSTIVPLLGRLHPPLLGAILPGTPPGPPDRSLLVPVVLGTLLIVPLPARVRPLARIPLAFAIGFSAGAAVPRVLTIDFAQQVRIAAAPLLVPGADGSIDGSASCRNAASVIATIAALVSLLYSGGYPGAPEGSTGASAPGRAGLSGRSVARSAVAALRRGGEGVVAVALGGALGFMILSRTAVLAGCAADMASIVRSIASRVAGLLGA
jgi:hypothetical protein